MQQSVFDDHVAGELDGVRIERLGQVATNMTDTVSRARRGGADAVLIDNNIPREPGGPKSDLGVETAMRIALGFRKSGQRGPRLVLWTTDPDPVVCKGFCLAGHHILGKDKSSTEARRLLVDVVINRARWTLPASDVSASALRYMAYIEAGYTARQTAEALGVAENTVEKARTRLAKALNITGGSRAVQSPEVARRNGLGWVSLDHGDLFSRLKAEMGVSD